MPKQETRQSGNDNTSNRGFASMDKDLQRDIASKGGKAAQANGNSHKFDSAEAREAGKKGGQSRSQGSSRDIDPDMDKKAGSEIDRAGTGADYQGRSQGGSGVESMSGGDDTEGMDTEGMQGGQGQKADRGDPGQSERDDTDRQGRPQVGGQSAGAQGRNDQGTGNEGRTRDDRHGGGMGRGIH